VQRSIEDDQSLSSTEKEQLIKARVGQGEFRQNVLMAAPRCRITGIENPALLRASHIKPWRFCSTSFERLGGYNGLALAPHADHLFDRGLISFSDKGEVLVSN
jgi:predicted restriction endonuclease